MTAPEPRSASRSRLRRDLRYITGDGVAFSVHVGLGETMTPEDTLEGVLRVTVLVAISRPAEFIEITFQQQMQKS